MSHAHPYHPSPSDAAGAPAGRQWVRWGFIYGGILIGLMVIQLPRLADWAFFSFYDPGTALKGDALISMGMKPAIDFGYTHGLATLIIAHIGFAILGRTAWAFLAMTAFLELLMGMAIARFAAAMQLESWPRIFLICALPVAIMPCYLTLTHPLEALLLLWAIAEQASGKRRRALAICTACLFVKPSMGYVYGLFLVIFTLWDVLRKKGGVALLWKETWPAMAAGVGMGLLTAGVFGIRSLVLTILPLTGMKTYQDTHFGFLLGSGMDFWSPFRHSAGYYFITPAGIWLLCAGITIVLTLRFLPQLRRGLPDCRTETCVSMGLMLLAFLLGFYGWVKSWEYYAYLPILFLAAWLATVKISRRWLAALCALAILSQSTHAVLSVWSWTGKLQNRETGGLWIYPIQYQDWQAVQKATQGKRTLVLSNGFMLWMPQNWHMPLSWFPEPGIPTPLELGRIGHEILLARRVVTWNTYGNKNVWNNPAMAAEKARFKKVWSGNYFTVWARRKE